MTDPSDPALDAAERATLAELCDALIPPAPGRLSATQAGITGALLDNLERFAPERLPLLREVIQRAAGHSPEAVLDRLQDEDAARFDLFCETTAALYFMAPAVRDAVRYPGRIAVAARTEIADLEELLLPVLEAGFAPRGYDAG